MFSPFFIVCKCALFINLFAIFDLAKVEIFMGDEKKVLSFEISIKEEISWGVVHKFIFK